MTDLFILPFLNIEFRRMITILLFPPSRFNNYQHITILKFFSIYIHTYILFFLLLFEYSCLHFLHATLPCPTHLHLPPLILPHLTLFTCPLHMFLDDPSPCFTHYPPPASSLVTVSSFFIPMSLKALMFIG